MVAKHPIGLGDEGDGAIGVPGTPGGDGVGVPEEASRHEVHGALGDPSLSGLVGDPVELANERQQPGAGCGGVVTPRAHRCRDDGTVQVMTHPWTVLFDEAQEGGRQRGLHLDVRHAWGVGQRIFDAALHLLPAPGPGVDVRLQGHGCREGLVQAVPPGQPGRTAGGDGTRLRIVPEDEGGGDLHVNHRGGCQCPLGHGEVPRLLQTGHRRPAQHVDRSQLVQCPGPPQREAVGLGDGEGTGERVLGSLQVEAALAPSQDLQGFAGNVGQTEALRRL